MTPAARAAAACAAAGVATRVLDAAAFDHPDGWRGGAALAAARAEPAELVLMLAPARREGEDAAAALAGRLLREWVELAALELAPATRVNALRGDGPDFSAALDLLLSAPSITGQVIDLA